MQVSSVKNVSFGANIAGDYSKIQHISRNAGYPLRYILKIDERLHQLFPEKGYTVKFVDTTKEVFDGCCSTYKTAVRKVKLIKNHQEVDFEPVELFKRPRCFSCFFDGISIRRIGIKHAEKYNDELEMIGLRQYLMSYYQAALRLASRAK